ADRRIDVTARDRNLAAKEVTEGTGFRRQVDGRLGPVAAQHPRPWMPEARATRRQRNDERQRDGEASPGHRSCGTTMADALRQFKRKAGYRFRREWTLVAHHAPRRGVRAHRREIHLGSGPDARVERSVTRARRMSRPAKAGATDKGTPAPPTPLWRYLSSTPKAGGFTAAAASADRAMRAGRVPRMPRWLRQPRHGSRAWYCPFTLASGSDPRHESRVALLAEPGDRVAHRGLHVRRAHERRDHRDRVGSRGPHGGGGVDRDATDRDDRQTAGRAGGLDELEAAWCEGGGLALRRVDRPDGDVIGSLALGGAQLGEVVRRQA